MTVKVSGDPEKSMLRLRRLEAWLAANHRPLALFTPDGRPLTQTVCLAVPEGEPEKAIAFKRLCLELGIVGSIAQWIVTAGAGTTC